ncbi:2388_t:CDS:2 [Acaulospora morrowiae]|uniref:2388_t:CDS:1 n=1 Tax=Acaulospora morrowiae TaxID=94023 RepID=A0A9N8VAI3_9GLOM|nr:2388_t:CDS:2 [Acaulospora morrowiae]
MEKRHFPPDTCVTSHDLWNSSIALTLNSCSSSRSSTAHHLSRLTVCDKPAGYLSVPDHIFIGHDVSRPKKNILHLEKIHPRTVTIDKFVKRVLSVILSRGQSVFLSRKILDKGPNPHIADLPK